jgi:hypothetical protein
LLSFYVPTVVMPKRGKKKRGGNGTRERPEVCGAAPATQRGGKRDQQPGTPRTEPLPGRGDGKGYQRYVGFGVMSYNLHVIGRELLARQRVLGDTLARAA